MRTVRLAGNAPTLKDQQRALVGRVMAAQHYAPVDWEGLRENLNSRVFVGPPAPLHVRKENQPDRQAERYWRLVADFKRYAYTELSETGTPYMGDVFGYQSEVIQ